jgi:hypothetical protein
MQASVRTGPPQIISAGFQPKDVLAAFASLGEIRSAGWPAACFRTLEALKSRACIALMEPFPFFAGGSATRTAAVDWSLGIDQDAGLEIPAFRRAAAILPCWVAGAVPLDSPFTGLRRMTSLLEARARVSLPLVVKAVVMVVIAGCVCGALLPNAEGLCCSKRNPRKKKYRPETAPSATGIIKALEPDKGVGRLAVTILGPRPSSYAPALGISG